MVTSVSAVAAYQKAIEASKKLQVSFEAQNQKLQPTAILRAGDDLRVIESQATPKSASFGEVLNRELIKNPVNAIGSATKTMFEVAKADGKELGLNLVELVESVDNAQLTLNKLVKVRDLSIAAYQEIMRMPI